MKAIIWKELRENIRWALLAVALFGGALLYALFYTSDGYGGSYYDGVTLAKKQVLLVTTFGCPIIGLFLGLAQILPELRRDQWSALLHRPVSRGRIYGGKALAGFFLYLFATGIPFGVAVYLAATPGFFGVPFVPGLMKPGLADIATGLVYYFAALTLALQRGGGMLLRVFPLLAALFISYFVQRSGLFYVAIEATLAMSLALLVAAWGAIHNQDSLAGRPWVARLAFFIVIFYGACGLGNLANTLLVALGPSPRRETVRYELNKEGQPMRLRYVNDVVVEVTDVEGKPITEGKYLPDRVRTQTIYTDQITFYIGDSHGWKPRVYKWPYRQSSGYLSSTSPYQYPRTEQWFRLVNPRTMDCYLPLTKEAVDRLDANGFQPLAAPIAPFPPEVEITQLRNDTLILSDASRLRLVLLPERRIIDLALPAPGPIYGVGTMFTMSEEGSIAVIAAALAEGVAIYDSKGQPRSLLPYHRDIGRWGSVSAAILEGGEKYVIKYDPSAWIKRDEQRTMPTYVEVVDGRGEVLESYTLPPLAWMPGGKSWSTHLKRRMQSPAFFLGDLLYRKVGAELGSKRLREGLNRQMGEEWSVTRETIIGSGVVSVLLALLTFFLARRAGFSTRQAGAWMLFVLALNVAGFLTFRLAADWPRRVACTNCGRRRAVNRQDCESCGTGWPPPAPSGLEIFDRPGTAA